jgi:hypothetical protein
MDATFLDSRITATRALIIAIEAALLALITGGAQSYTMDTGQTRQTVNKLDVPALQRQLNGAYALLDALETRAGSGSVIAGPLC